MSSDNDQFRDLCISLSAKVTDSHKINQKLNAKLKECTETIATQKAQISQLQFELETAKREISALVSQLKSLDKEWDQSSCSTEAFTPSITRNSVLDTHNVNPLPMAINQLGFVETPKVSQTVNVNTNSGLFDEMDTPFDYDAVCKDFGESGAVDQWCFYKPSPKFYQQYMANPELTIQHRAEDEVLIERGDDLMGYPILTFAELTTKYAHDDVKITNSQGEKLSPFDLIVEQFKKKGFIQPRPVQKHCWGPLMSGCDLLGIAKTGSGKTLGFMLPAIFHILKKDEKNKLNGEPTHQEKFLREGGAHPDVLVIAPTRELAIQIKDETAFFCDVHKILVAVVVGRQPKSEQIPYLTHHTRIVCGVMGRLQDFVFTEKKISLRNVTMLIIDEADEMLDNSFAKEITRVSDAIRPDRQCAFFSATWSDGCQEYADYLLRNKDRMVKLRIGGAEDEIGHVKNIYHDYRILNGEKEKERWLFKFLKGGEPKYADANRQRVMVFTNTKKRCKALFNAIDYDSELNAIMMNGDMEQCDRIASLEKFKNGESRILVTSPLTGRGLDIPDVAYVVHFEPPNMMTDFTHRSGRTGRGDKEGTSILLFASNADKTFAKQIIEEWPKLGKGVQHNASLMQLKDFLNG